MKVAVVGAGLMGRAIVYDLVRQENIKQVTLFDVDLAIAQTVAKEFGQEKTQAIALDVATVTTENNPFIGHHAVISAVTYKFNVTLAKLAIAAKAHFFDLGGNNDIVAKEFALHEQAKAAGVVVIPDCGLAPGMVSVLTASGIAQFDQVEAVKIRVGGLPQTPKPPLNYQLVFSPEGLINEYWEPVSILQNGEITMVEPMSAIESLEFAGLPPLEAFYTSGGTSTLPQSYQHEIKFLDYKTIRYQGHCQLFRPMLDIGLASREPLQVNDVAVEPRELFKAVLSKTLNYNEADLTLVRIDFVGQIENDNKQLRYEIVDRADQETGLSAMMRTTAFPIAIIANMALLDIIKERGVLPQEQVVDPDYFIQQIRKRNIDLRQVFID